MTKKQLTVILITLIVIAATTMMSACASGVLAGTTSGVEAQIQTAAAATVVQYMIETQVAVQSRAIAVEPAAQAQPTDLPAPTATQVPTQTAVPTAVPTTAPTAVPTDAPTATPAALAAAVAGPRIVADQNTNCRLGPSTGYTIQPVFAKGTESHVEGRNTNKNWWYIANPNAAGGYCWVWEGSTTVVGDTSTVAVVDAPVIAAPKVNNWYYGGYTCKVNNFCGNYPNNNCWRNKNNCCWWDPDWSYWETNYCNYWPGYWTSNKWGPACGPNKFWKCDDEGNCKCKAPPKAQCPAVTVVNYKKYCKNYPQCCSASWPVFTND